MKTYRSRRADDASAGTAALVGSALARPIGVCMLPVMLGALTAMLSGMDPLPYLVWGFPAAAAVASFWTRHHLKTHPVEISVYGPTVRVRTLWDLAASRPEGSESGAVLDVREDGDDLRFTLGLDGYRISKPEWPHSDRLAADLRAAHRAHTEDVQRRIDS